MTAPGELVAGHIGRLRSAAIELELEADLFERQMARADSPEPDDTIPSPPPSQPPAVIASGQAVPVVASTIDAATTAPRELAAVADACARALDATAKPRSEPTP